MCCIDQIVEITVNIGDEMLMTDRVLSYTKLEPEAELTSSNSPTDLWPSKGNIEFKNVNFKYRKSAPNVLNCMNFSIRGGSKVSLMLI